VKCPYCKSNQDHVLESRTLSEGEAIRRRRECLVCKGRFTSYERVEDKPLMIRKNDGQKEYFQKEKILKGILRATEKRPVSVDKIENAVAEITESLRNNIEREVGSQEIGVLVMKKLSELDQVAYVRFASVYKQFEDIGEFIKEIKNM
jgi:transcriptional repressor NrdR